MKFVCFTLFIDFDIFRTIIHINHVIIFLYLKHALLQVQLFSYSIVSFCLMNLECSQWLTQDFWTSRAMLLKVFINFAMSTRLLYHRLGQSKDPSRWVNFAVFWKKLGNLLRHLMIYLDSRLFENFVNFQCN